MDNGQCTVSMFSDVAEFSGTPGRVITMAAANKNYELKKIAVIYWVFVLFGSTI